MPRSSGEVTAEYTIGLFVSRFISDCKARDAIA